jgi:hypothetical protein
MVAELPKDTRQMPVPLSALFYNPNIFVGIFFYGVIISEA